tara:strand:+ start:2301 stop:2552 length:252 start_codon:yes stop_codon:yes gene_type:complete
VILDKDQPTVIRNTTNKFVKGYSSKKNLASLFSRTFIKENSYHKLNFGEIKQSVSPINVCIYENIKPNKKSLRSKGLKNFLLK